MKLKDIKETGFYIMLAYKDTEDEIIYEATENTDNEWLKDDPDAKIVMDEWYFDDEENGKKIYQTSGGIYSLGLDLAEIEVEKVDKHFETFGTGRCSLKEIKWNIFLKQDTVMREIRYPFLNRLKLRKKLILTYCGEIGKKYLKTRENDVRIVNSPCQDNTVLWKTGVVSEDFVEENTLMFKLYYEDIKREMVETLKDYLKAQIEEIEVC